MTDLRPGHFLFDTSLGVFGLAWSNLGLSRLLLPGLAGEAAERRLTATRGAFSRAEFARDSRIGLESLLPAPIAALVADIRRYAGGAPADFSAVRLDLRGVGDFRKAVYRETRKLGYGEVATYGELAERAGHKGLFRETGQAMATNPVPLVVPCHRVLAAGGRIGGFSAPGGSAAKARMLALEGVSLDPPEPAQASFGF